MNVNTESVYFVICGAALLLMGLGIGLAAIMPGIDRWNKRFFITFFSVLFLFFLFSLIDITYAENLGIISVRSIVYFWMDLLCAVPLPMLTMYLLHSCKEDWRNSLLFWAVLTLFGFFVILIVVAQFTSFFYYLTPDNQLRFGEWYLFVDIVPIMIELLNLEGVFRRRKKLTRKILFAMLIVLIPMTIALNVHLFIRVFPFLQISIVVSALSMYFIILSDQIEQYLRQQQEIAHKNANILVLQMRPHFIHNTLLSIYYLCRQDPEEAQRVTLDFNTYLEKNLAALASDETIPFSEELEHTVAYLNVEQTLYDENLFVEYDTPHTVFRVPPLTLQPIVENAIKHGLDPDSEPLFIFIQTRETDFGNEIIVSDNGPGFKPADDDKPHIALANIRQRLKMMCRGEMTIMPREGKGTVVKLIIP